jgi:hypothetical protein
MSLNNNDEFHGEALYQFVYMGVYTLSGKPRWACAMCGMYSSRKYSVKRHIYNLHDGLANIVSFIDYIAGRRQGVYFPNLIPSYLTKQSQTTAPKTSPLDVMKDELFRIALRKSWISIDALYETNLYTGSKACSPTVFVLALP